MSFTSSGPRVGAVLSGRYRIVAPLAEGSMGSVYRGERLGIGRPVAVKFLHGSIAGERQFMKRFEREAMAMSRLSHPHCVPVIDYGSSDDGSPFVIMDFAEGQTLAEMLEAGPLSPERAIRVGMQILAGLEHCHRRGIVHRDVKPSNVILSDYAGVGEHARLVDFGLASMPRAHSDLTETRIAVGTPTYMSPEQSRGEKVDPRADVYGVGVLLYRMLTGRRPYDADDTDTMLLLHREAPVPTLSERSDQSEYSTELETVIATALAKVAAERFPSALKFSQALGRVPEARGVSVRAAREARTRKRLIAGATAAALLVCFLAVRVGSGGPSGETAPLVPPAPFLAPVEGLTLAPTVVTIPEPVAVNVPEPVVVPIFVAVASPLAAVRATASELSLPVAGAGLPAEAPAPLPPVVIPSGEPPTLAEVMDLITLGDDSRATAMLEELVMLQPENGYIPYLLGKLYGQAGNYQRAVFHYGQALRLSSSYRKRVQLNRDLIHALGPPETRTRARAVILRYIKRAAIPHLKRAVVNDEDEAVRKEASRLVDRLRGS